MIVGLVIDSFVVATSSSLVAASDGILAVGARVVLVVCISPVVASSSKLVVLLLTLVWVTRKAIVLSAFLVASFLRWLVVPSFTPVMAAGVVVTLSISLTECPARLVVASSNTLVMVGGVVSVFSVFADNFVVVMLLEAMIVDATWLGSGDTFIAIVEDKVVLPVVEIGVMVTDGLILLVTMLAFGVSVENVDVVIFFKRVALLVVEIGVKLVEGLLFKGAIDVMLLLLEAILVGGGLLEVGVMVSD